MPLSGRKNSHIAAVLTNVAAALKIGAAPRFSLYRHTIAYSNFPRPQRYFTGTFRVTVAQSGFLKQHLST
jgi:hypothetical protein